jgi:DHA3 family macrolide efflux protein-like MFS transporter
MKMQPDYGTFRSYLFFLSGQLVSLLGSSIAQFVIIWWITLETGSALFLSLASLLGLAPMILLSPFAGVFVDRWSRRGLVGVVDFLQALATVMLIFLFVFGLVSVWHVLALLTVRGVLQAFHRPAVSAITPSMVPKERLSRMNGLNYLFNGAVTLIGPVVAALLLGFLEIFQILWIDVVTFLAALVPLLVIQIPSVRKGEEKASFREDFAEGFGFIKNTRGLLPFLVLATALNFLIVPVPTLGAYYVKFDHLGGASELALLMASFQGGMLAGGLLMSVIKGFKKKMVVILSFSYILFLGYAIVALTPTGLFWFMALGALVMAFGIPIINVSYLTIVQTVVPLEMQGRVNSVDMALSSAAQPFGMILSGAVVGLTGTADLFLACSISGILILTLSWFATDIKYVEKMEEKSTEKLTKIPA